jgi:hypothetical protein
MPVNPLEGHIISKEMMTPWQRGFICGMAFGGLIAMMALLTA